jgi:hypothetical protein
VDDRKENIQPTFPTLIMGAGGRPTYFKMGKNVKVSLFLHAIQSGAQIIETTA